MYKEQCIHVFSGIPTEPVVKLPVGREFHNSWNPVLVQLLTEYS